jgi:hypothetical protein
MSSGVKPVDVQAEVEKHADYPLPPIVSRAGWRGVIGMAAVASQTFNLPWNDEMVQLLANCLVNYENCKENLPCPPSSQDQGSVSPTGR